LVTKTAGATTSEISYLSGVTSAIQTQLNSKVDLTSDQTVGGIKTFSISPVVGTPSPDTSDGSAASTAFVQKVLTVSAHPAVRQTVLSGTVDSNGLPAFGGSTGSTTVTAPTTLTATAAFGTLDLTGTITNPSWTGLNTNGKMYLYLTINTDGTCTTGASTLAPIYQWSGTYTNTTGQFTFNIQEMTGKVGVFGGPNQTYRVYVGEVTVSGGVVSSITWYALKGRFDGGWTNTLPGTGVQVIRSHNIGLIPDNMRYVIECLTADAGYAVGDRIYYPLTGTNSGYSQLNTAFANSSTCGFVVAGGGASAFVVSNKSNGVQATLVSANWRYKLVADRGW
jgi:hypothetical protein